MTIIKFDEKFMDKHGDIVLEQKRTWKQFISSIWYMIDWRNKKVINVHKWFCDCLEECGEHTGFMDLVDYFKKKYSDEDKKVIAVLNWIRSNITYVGDTVTWGVGEKWQHPLETLFIWRCPYCKKELHKGTSPEDSYNCSCKKTVTKKELIRTADCEDGACVIGALLHFLEINPNQWNVTCGYVKSGSTKGGHAYVEYTSRTNALTFAIDWCYWYSGALIQNRIPISADPNYLEVWFGFNSSFSWKEISDPNKKFTEEIK